MQYDRLKQTFPKAENNGQLGGNLWSVASLLKVTSFEREFIVQERATGDRAEVDLLL